VEVAVQRLYGITIPLLLVAFEAIPTIPMLFPASSTASGIVAADDGTVYFADSFHNMVWQIQPGGRVTPFVTGRSSRWLQIDDRGNIYGTRLEQRGRVVLWRADPAGVVTDLHRVSLMADHNHAFAVADGGRIIGWSGSFAIGAMAHTATGDLIVTSGATVRRICRDGVVTTVAAGHPLLQPRKNLLTRLFGQPVSHLSGVALAGNGDIYVANSARGTVVRIDRSGGVSNALVSDAGWTPTGVAIAGGSVVYVLEYGAGVRVRRLSDGAGELMAHVRSTGGALRDAA
jgi:sugar lactone lactonase YvrE